MCRMTLSRRLKNVGMAYIYVVLCFALTVVDGLGVHARNYLRSKDSGGMHGSPNAQSNMLVPNGPTYNSKHEFVNRRSEMVGTEGYQADPFDPLRGVGFGSKLCQKLKKSVEGALQDKKPDEEAFKSDFETYMKKCQLLNGSPRTPEDPNPDSEWGLSGPGEKVDKEGEIGCKDCPVHS